MAEQTSDTSTEEPSVPPEVAAPANGAHEPAAANGEAPGGRAEEVPAAQAGAQELPAVETPGADETQGGDEAGARVAPPPGRGPVVLADERGKPEPKLPTTPRRGKGPLKTKPQRPRRRKRSAAERHRAVFFARLNEVRRGEQTGASAGTETEAQEAEQPAVEGAPIEEPVAEAREAEHAAAEQPAVEQPAAEEPTAEEPAAEERAAERPAAEEPAAEQPAGEDPAADEPTAEEVEQPGGDAAPAGAQPAPGRRAAPPPPVSHARLAAAVQRVGGPEVVEEALRPKMDEQGERKKWALVCCEAAQGRQAGDPEFTAWVRLAATPVREIKASLPVREEQGRGGGRRGGPGRGGDRPSREGGGERGRGGDRGRGGRGDRVSRDELEAFARGGKLTSKVRIVDPAAEKRERERQRKEERERKRQAERERLNRLGY